MEFDIKKPSHIFALLCLIFGTFTVTILLPILSFFIDPSESLSYLETISEYARGLFELFALTLQLVIVILAFIIVPFLWYILVNKLSLKEILSRIQLHFKKFDMIFIWAVVAVVTGFVIIFIAGIIMTFFNNNLQDFSNIPDLELIFSIPSILISLQFNRCVRKYFTGDFYWKRFLH